MVRQNQEFFDKTHESKRLNHSRRSVFAKFLRQIQKKLPDLTGVAVVGMATLCTSGVVLGVRQLGAFQHGELMVFDRLMQWRSDEPPDPRIAIVEISEEDIQAEKWPLSDRILAQVLENLQRYEPVAIGLDLYRDLPQPPGHPELLKELEAPNIIAIRNASPGVNPPPTVPADRIGFNDLVMDPDGPIRRNLISFVSNGNTNFSFSLKLAMLYLGDQGLFPQPSETQPGHIVWGKAVLAPLQPNSGGYTHLDAQGFQILLNYRSRKEVAPSIPLSEVLADRLEPEWIRDKIIVIGTTAASIKDVHYTPYSSRQDNPLMPGVLIHTQMLSQLLSSVLDGRPLFWVWPEWAEVLWVMSWITVGGTIAWLIRHPLILPLVGGVSAASLCVVSGILFTQAGWVPVVTPLVGLAIALAGVVAFRAYQSGQQQQIVMKLLGQNAAPEIADALWENRDRLLKDGKLPGQKLTATMLFTDLKDFSTISEQMPPEALLEWLNEYLDVLSQVIQEHQGIINKFTGDGIMAAFGVPLPRHSSADIARDARNAVASGLAMGDRLQELNRNWQKRGLPVIQMRVGIFTGAVVAGSLGGKERQEYGIIGDSVNIASRLESCEKDRQASICRVLIAYETLIHIQDEYNVEHWGPLALKGKQQTVDVYRVVNRRTPTS
ncbi:adenylate/guanylate cyclase domain-containing protein [Laspinema sp. A4]|nr:adenylate/guanylate cyclase domain-containing protein [Laspinema sp. D2d]MCT7984093.1 adenylate/guanylate cyclase domain-containing protein [Laspinema sp. D2d]